MLSKFSTADMEDPPSRTTGNKVLCASARGHAPRELTVMLGGVCRKSGAGRFADLCNDRTVESTTEQVLPKFLPDQCPDNGKWETGIDCSSARKRLKTRLWVAPPCATAETEVDGG